MPHKMALRNWLVFVTVCVDVAIQCETVMVGTERERNLSVRAADDILESVDRFRRAQLALPSQTEALRVLIKLGFERWKADQAAAER